MAPEELPRPRPEDSNRFGGFFVPRQRIRAEKQKKKGKCGGTPGEEHFYFIESTFRIQGENPGYKSSNHWVISVALGIFGPVTHQKMVHFGASPRFWCLFFMKCRPVRL